MTAAWHSIIFNDISPPHLTKQVFVLYVYDKSSNSANVVMLEAIAVKAGSTALSPTSLHYIIV